MNLKSSERVVLTIVLGFFTLIIVFALFIKCNHNDNKLNIPNNSENSQKLQNRIDEYYETHKESNEEISVQSSKSKDVYFAFIMTNKKSKIGNYNIPIYKVYYYSINDDLELARSEVLEKFGYTDEYVKDKIKSHLRNLYRQEIAEGYVEENECDFDSCYLSFYRNINNLDDYALYAEDDRLYAYLSFDIDSLIGDREFFEKQDNDYYKIEIN